MIAPAPAEALCALHPLSRAAWVCPRCGAFMCGACERRTRPDAVPMCAGCWEVRTRNVGEPRAEKASTALQTGGLVLGAASLLPLPTVQFASVVIGIIGLVLARTEAARKVRWRPIVGLCLTLVGVGIDVLVYA